MNFRKIRQPFVMILIGPPLSGKSTFIKNNFTKDIDDKRYIDVKVISRDQIVLDLSGTDNYDYAFQTVSHRDVDAELHRQLEEAADNGKNVIVDMTNLSSKRRKGTLSYFDDSFTKIAVIFPILDWDVYMHRNEERKEKESKNISEKLLKNMIKSYQSIKEDEGFDRVISL